MTKGRQRKKTSIWKAREKTPKKTPSALSLRKGAKNKQEKMVS